MKPLAILKRDAAQACVDRFLGRPLVWGSADCARLVAHDLHQMKIGVPFLKGAKYRSEAGAARELKRLGFSGLMDAVDALGLQRIPVAAATDADIVAFATEGRLWDCALTVVVGPQRVLGFGEIEGQLRAGVAEPNLSAALAAWSVL